MAKHRNVAKRSKKVAALGAVTVTATALTVGVSPPAKAQEANAADVDLRADVRPWPHPSAIPDLTGGLGAAGYNVTQDFAEIVIRAIVENLDLSALAQRAGLDPQSLLNNLVGEVIGGLLGEAGLGGLGVNIPGLLEILPLGGLLDALNIPLLSNLLMPILGGSLEAGTSLGALLGLLGLNLGAPLDLSEVGNLLGVNIVTTGPAFNLLKILGADLGWVPETPNAVAEAINNTDYLNVGLHGLLGALGVELTEIGLINDILTGTLGFLFDPILNIPDVVGVRAPIVIGYGAGAFSAGQAYQQVVDQLGNQPGGSGPAAADHLLGSITILPLILLDNPGRANGGLFARAYPLLQLLGIDSVTRDTHVQHDGTGIPALGTGISLGAANLIPIKLDATVQYLPLSDFAAWPNAFSLFNNVFAGLMPTYILRGLELDDVGSIITDQLTPQLVDVLGDAAQGNPLAINLYVTVPVTSLPLLEPTYLIVDAINLVTGLNLNNPIGTALGPVLTNLVNLGYTDVQRVWNEDAGYWEYVRTFDDTATPTGFYSFPEIDWVKVPGDLFGALAAGVRQAFADGLVNRDGPVNNALATVLRLLGVDDLLSGLGLGGLTEQLQDAVDGILGGLGLAEAPASTLAAANSLPDDGARRVVLATGEETPAPTEEPVVEGAGEATGTGDESDDEAAASEPDEQTGAETLPRQKRSQRSLVVNEVRDISNKATPEDRSNGSADSNGEDGAAEQAGDESVGGSDKRASRSTSRDRDEAA